MDEGYARLTVQVEATGEVRIGHLPTVPGSDRTDCVMKEPRFAEVYKEDVIFEPTLPIGLLSLMV